MCQKDEPVEFLGIIIHGSAFVEGEHRNLKELKIGDMIGHNVTSEFTDRTDHLTSVKAKTDGLLAVFPLNEVKIEIRKNPDAVSSFMINPVGVQNYENCCKLLHGDSVLQRAWPRDQSKGPTD